MCALRNFTNVTPTMKVYTHRFCLEQAAFLKRHHREIKISLNPSWRYTMNTSSSSNNNNNSININNTNISINNNIIKNSRRMISSKSKTTNDMRRKALEVGLITDPADVPLIKELSFNKNYNFPPKKNKKEKEKENKEENKEIIIDPLLEFLEKHEEDAALLLAMWTSLRRSCLHASEISENIILTARWCLHHLIHSKAMGAAVRFYQILLSLGIQLQKWDVIVLLRNLPYERSTTIVNAESESWMQEKTNNINNKNNNSNNSDSHHYCQREKETIDGSNNRIEKKDELKKNSDNEKEFISNSSSSLSSSSSSSSSSSCLLNKSLKEKRSEDVVRKTKKVSERNLSIIDKVSFRNEPDWVKRWVLYEASMGNMDLFDDENLDNISNTNLNNSISKETDKITGVMALLNHLMLLQDAKNNLISNEYMKKKQNQHQHHSIKIRKPYFIIKNSYWSEALEIANSFLNSRLKTNCNNIPLPEEFINVMQRAVIASGSWVVSLRYLQMAETYNFNLYEKDYINFMLISLETQPWKHNHFVEKFVAKNIIPKFINENAAGYASKAIWLVYICSIKLNKPEIYVELLEDQNTMNLPSMIKLIMAYAKLASSHLRIEIDRYRSDILNQQTLATSVRLGLYSQENELIQENNNENFIMMKKINNNNNNNSILSENLKNSFNLVCISIYHVVTLAPITVISQNDAIQLSTLLVDTLYSHIGVWGIFSELYLSKNDISSRKTSEKIFIATTILLCIIRITLTFCETHNKLKLQNRGIQLLTVKQLILLLNMSIEALLIIPSYSVEIKEIQKSILTITHYTWRLTREIFNFFNFSSINEKLLFGSISEETVESITLIIRILLLLHVNYPKRRFPISIQFRLRSFLRPSSGFGKQVRRKLKQKEIQQLDKLLYRNYLRKGNNNNNLNLNLKLCTLSQKDIEKINKIAKIHKFAYSIILLYENNLSLMEYTFISKIKLMEWDEILLLEYILLHHLRLPPGTFSVTFFEKFLETLSSKISETSKEKNIWEKLEGIYWDALNHILYINNNNNNNNNNSISSPSEVKSKKVQSIYEKKQLEKYILSSLLLPIIRLSMITMKREKGWEWLNKWISLYSFNERNINWKILNIQARSLLRERRALQMCLKLFHEQEENFKNEKNNEFTFINTLETKRNFLSASPVSKLLCEVAENHSDWSFALETLVETFMSPNNNNNNNISPLPSFAVSSIMRILCRAPINLSNTALKLRAIQGENWDLQNANGLLLLLVRQRRWRLALQHVSEMFPILSKDETILKKLNENNKEINNNNNNNNNEEEQIKINKALFLLHALRACANGGCSEEAAVYYDYLKTLLNNSHSPSITTNITSMKTNSHGNMKHLEKLLFSTMESNEKTEDKVSVMVEKVETENEKKLLAILGQARLYFLRAMTKKSLTKNGKEE